MHPRPSPIAASLYTLRDLNADVIILHGPHGCCFRTGRLLENDGVRVVTTAMSENDFIFGASNKLEETLHEVESLFHPSLVGVVGTCASMIIGEDLKEAVQRANINATVLAVESHGGFGEGDNTEGAIVVLNAAVKEGIIPPEEALRQIEMLKKATEIEKSRGMAQGKYLAPSYGDNKEEVAREILKSFESDKKIGIILNAKKETSYLFADILRIPFYKIYPDNPPFLISNLDPEIGLPRIRNHAQNIIKELKSSGIEIDLITGGLDEYPMTGEKAASFIKDQEFDLIMVLGVPHAMPLDGLDMKSIAVSDGPRLVDPLKKHGYDSVIIELDAHAKTLGKSKIVASEFGETIRNLLNI